MSRYKPYPQYKDSGIEWLGQVPEHWTTIRLKYIMVEKRKKIAPSLPCGAISFGNVVYKEAESIPVATRETYQEVLCGEFLINPINLNYDLKSLRTALSEIDVCVSPAYIVLDSGYEFEKSFLKYLLFCFDILHMKTLGAGVRQTITFNDIGNCFVCIPFLAEQCNIAKILDRETTRIDALIEKKSRFIELLQEKRQALLTQAVTKGLDPNANLKDSGVKWLGLVPEHWDILRLKHISAFITSGPRGWSDFINDDGNEIFLQSGDLNDNLEILPNTAKRISAPTGAEAKRTLLEENDIVVCITGANTGRVALVKTTSSPIYINQHLCLIRLQAHRLLPKYLTLLLSSHSGRSYFNFTQYGLKEGLSLTNIATFPIMLPPYEEQQKICKYIDSINLKYNSLITATQRSIELLKERRTALITAAVTGQIDLRDSATGEGEIL